VGGGCGELSGRGEEGVAVGVAGTGGVGGVTEKTGNGLGRGNRTRDALQSMVILCRERKSKPRIGFETFACKKLYTNEFFPNFNCLQTKFQEGIGKPLAFTIAGPVGDR
jgi:hypothetical protein